LQTVLVEAWGASSARPGAAVFLGAVADSLARFLGQARLGIYMSNNRELVRVATYRAGDLSAARASAAAPDAVQGTTHVPVGSPPSPPRQSDGMPGFPLPRSVELDAPTAQGAPVGWVETGDSSLWFLCESGLPAKELLASDPCGLKAILAAIAMAASVALKERTERQSQIDSEIRDAVIRATMNPLQSVELFLAAAISGFAGQRGFVALWDPESQHGRILGQRGDISATLQGINLDRLGDTWVATVSDSNAIAPDAKAIYAIAKVCRRGVLLCVVASARGAEAVSPATAGRIDQALSIMTTLLNTEEETRLTKARGIQMLLSLAAMADADPRCARHHQRVEAVATWAARTLELSKEATRPLMRATQFHDVGRVAIPSDATTTALEFMHPQVSAMLLRTFGENDEVVRLVSLHHERYDGLGFPAGISPDARDDALWCLIAAEGIVETAESKRINLTEALQEWLRGRAQGLLPPAVLQKFRERTEVLGKIPDPLDNERS